MCAPGALQPGRGSPELGHGWFWGQGGRGPCPHTQCLSSRMVALPAALPLQGWGQDSWVSLLGLASTPMCSDSSSVALRCPLPVTVFPPAQLGGVHGVEPLEAPSRPPGVWSVSTWTRQACLHPSKCCPRPDASSLGAKLETPDGEVSVELQKHQSSTQDSRLFGRSAEQTHHFGRPGLSPEGPGAWVYLPVSP